jgi:hypothetical protein
MPTPIEEGCPKCGTPQPSGADACPRCGLLRERFAGFSDSPEPHPALDAAFATLCDRWHDPEAHRAFVDAAAAQGGLDLASAHYRRWLNAHPGDAAATQGIERARRFAEELAAATARSPDRAGLRRLLWVLALLVGLAVVGFGLALSTRMSAG